MLTSTYCLPHVGLACDQQSVGAPSIACLLVHLLLRLPFVSETSWMWLDVALDLSVTNFEHQLGMLSVACRVVVQNLYPQHDTDVVVIRNDQVCMSSSLS